jgi:hypothetical protein
LAGINQVILIKINFVAQSVVVPVTFRAYKSQLTPSAHVDSLADAPPVGGPLQLFVGPAGPIVPDAGVAANEDGSGVNIIEKAKIKTASMLNVLEALNADNLMREALNFLRFPRFLPFLTLWEVHFSFELVLIMLLTPQERRVSLARSRRSAMPIRKRKTRGCYHPYSIWLWVEEYLRSCLEFLKTL